jgi:hypothetical protein
MDMVTLADVRALLGHLPKETRTKSTWQHVEAELKKAAASGDTAQVSIALQKGRVPTTLGCVVLLRLGTPS